MVPPRTKLRHPIVDKDRSPPGIWRAMLKYPHEVEEAIVDGQPIFLVGVDPRVLARRLHELCRRHHEAPYWVACARDTAALSGIDIAATMIANRGDSQKQSLISALRQDPDGLIANPLFPQAAEIFLRALVSGHNFAVYATLEASSVADVLRDWRSHGVPDDVLAPALEDILFIECRENEIQFFEAELADGLIDIWTPEGLEVEAPKLRLVAQDGLSVEKASAAMKAPMQSPAAGRGHAARGPDQPRLTADEIHAWIQERPQDVVKSLLGYARSAFVPLTQETPHDVQLGLVRYARARGQGELFLQIQAEQVPPSSGLRLPPRTHLQAFAGSEPSAGFHIELVSESERRRSPVGFPAGTYFRGKHQLRRWLEVQDFPHPKDYARLGLKDLVNGVPPLPSTCVPYSKLGGWPSWQNESLATEALVFQINPDGHEFELFRGPETMTYIVGAAGAYRLL